MAATSIQEIESQFAQLPRHAQLGLLERLVHHLRVNGGGAQSAWAKDMAEMAADPEVQAELRQINREFALAEADGLGKE